jgi:acetyl-CoA synthetase
MVTYRQLHEATCRLAGALTNLGVKKGDRVCIDMPMIIEAAVAMLACARIGAVHSVVFGGFSPGAITDRIEDSGATLVITADEGRRGGKTVPIKANIDAALAHTDRVRHVVVVRHTGGDVAMRASRDVWYHEAVAAASPVCAAAAMAAEDPLFVLYTSGSTGKPKGVLHTTGGYLVYVSMTQEYVFDWHIGARRISVG